MLILKILLFFSIFICLSLQTHISAQDKSKLFSSDYVEFLYPSDWDLLDKSDKENIHLRLSIKNKHLLILLSSPRIKTKNPDTFLVKHRYDILTQYADVTEKTLSNPQLQAKKSFVCSDLKGKKIGSVKFRGIHKSQPATGNIYSLILDNRVINLVYLRTDKDREVGDFAWKSLIESLKVNGKQDNYEVFSFISEKRDLASLAVKLKKPRYPSGLKYNPKFQVIVRIVIDQEGKVIKARQLGSRSLFSMAAVGAAKKSTFKPSISCGKTVKTVGTIVYNFG